MATGARTPRCSVDGCLKLRRYVKTGYCSMHYSRWHRYGDVTVLQRAPKTAGASPAARKAWLEKYKLEKGCTDCGYNAHPAALDFDHLPGTVKLRDIRHGSSLGWVALMNEIEKCEVVCANCHRIRTVKRQQEVMTAC